MSELISHCYKNCLHRCEEKWVLKLWGQMTSRSQLFTWNSCGGHHCHCPNFHCHYNQRHQNMYLHITHTKYRPLAQHSYAKPWLQLKENRVSEWVVPLLQLYNSKNRGSWPVCLFVTWDSSILNQAVLEANSEADQLTNGYAGRCVRKHSNAWPVNNAWDSNHAFLRVLTARC